MALTTDQITEAYQILTRLQDMQVEAKDLAKVGKADEAQKIYDAMVDMTNVYYSLIPSRDFSYSSGTELANKYQIAQEITKLQEIYDFSRSFKIAIGALISKHPLQYVCDMLPIKLQRLADKGSKDFAMIMRYINQSMKGNKRVQANNFVVSNIYKLDDSHKSREDNEVFSSIHNHWMLWHGTRNENIMSILLKGLMIKPPNANHNGSLFGEAIYFADTFTKSLNVTHSLA